MIIHVRSERMVILSDLHIGNPFSSVRRRTVEFLDWASQNGYDICLNGDGFDVAQVSLSSLVRDVPEVLKALKRAVARGSKVFYVVGNHDMVFEHFFHDWGFLQLSPFLNVTCGSGRFRVEHGHLYDPFFVTFPRLYELSTWLAGFALKVHPALYGLWIRFERWKGRVLQMRFGTQPGGILGEPRSFYDSAAKIEARGFDAVIFGHTHHSGSSPLPLGGRYLNPGSWMLSFRYVKIEEGRAELEEFRPAIPWPQQAAS